MVNMELWIRSQDKRRLMKASNIYLDEEIEYDNRKYAIKCGTIDIGYYTFYRALEVLDEIQKEIINSYYDFDDDDEYINNISHIVYEMPKEQE